MYIFSYSSFVCIIFCGCFVVFSIMCSVIIFLKRVPGVPGAASVVGFVDAESDRVGQRTKALELKQNKVLFDA